MNIKNIFLVLTNLHNLNNFRKKCKLNIIVKKGFSFPNFHLVIVIAVIVSVVSIWNIDNNCFTFNLRKTFYELVNLDNLIILTWIYGSLVVNLYIQAILFETLKIIPWFLLFEHHNSNINYQRLYLLNNNHDTITITIAKWQASGIFTF